MARLLETQSGGKPTVVFDAAKQGPWAFSTLPAGEISLLYSQTITNQANVWLAVSAVSNLHDDETGIIKRYNRFISDNPDPFFKTKSLAKTALVWPQNSGNYYSGTPVPLTDFTKEVKNEKGGNTMEEFYGFYDGLARSHCPFDVLDEKALESDISVYDLIIFPNVTCLSPEASAKIRSYVQTGGNIISSFETSRYNQHGKRLDDFELNDVYGIKSAGDIFGPLRWDYLSPTGSQHFSLREIKNKFLNAPSYGLKVLSDGKTPLLFCKPLPGSYSGSPEVSEYPFMVENEYGNGKSVYLAGTFGGSLYRYHFPEYYRILLNLVSEMSELPVKLENAPSSVEISIRKKASTIFLYLINFTSEMKRPIKRIIPCSNIGAEVVINGDVSKVTALWSATELEFTRKKNSISFKLPLLEDYEVVRIDQ
jgi:beta-galactosidase GanA